MANKTRVKVWSQVYAGKTLNVPHTDHKGLGNAPTNVERGKQSVTFDNRGEAEVPRVVADALLEFYPKFVVELAPAEA